MGRVELLLLSEKLVTRWAEPHDQLLENSAFVSSSLGVLLGIPLLVVLEVWR